MEFNPGARSPRPSASVEELLNRYGTTLSAAAAMMYTKTADLIALLDSKPRLDQLADVALAVQMSLEEGSVRFDTLFYELAELHGFSRVPESQIIGADLLRGTRALRIGVVKSPPMCDIQDGVGVGGGVDYVKRMLRIAGVVNATWIPVPLFEVTEQVMSRTVDMVVPLMRLQSRHPVAWSLPVSSPIAISCLAHRLTNVLFRQSIPAPLEVLTIRGEAGDIAAQMAFRGTQREVHDTSDQAVRALKNRVPAGQKSGALIVADSLLCRHYSERDPDLVVCELPVPLRFKFMIAMHPAESTLLRVVNSAIEVLGPMEYPSRFRDDDEALGMPSRPERRS